MSLQGSHGESVRIDYPCDWKDSLRVVMGVLQSGCLSQSRLGVQPSLKTSHYASEALNSGKASMSPG